MTILSRLGQHPRSLGMTMQLQWRWLMGVGVALVVLGLFGLYASTLVAKAMTGAIAGLLILAGVLQLSQSLLLHGMPSFAMTVALGVAQIAGGVAIWTHPEWAAFAVSVTIALVLLVQAVAQWMLGLRLDNAGGRWVSIASGTVALAAALVCLAGVRWAGRSAPAWSMSVALLAMGLAYLGIAWAYRRARAPA